MGTGILLNNSLDNFSWGRNGEPNSPAPGKRLGSTITPMIVFDDDKPWIVTGTPGGGYIIATMVQLISNVIDHQLNIAEAAIRPAHAPYDGDTLFCLSTGKKVIEDPAMRQIAVAQLGNVAADVLARAIARGVYHATNYEGVTGQTWREMK